MSGTIAFKYFPAANWRVPGFFAEFDASQANTALPAQRSLVVGQMLASGTATPNVPVLTFSQAQVAALCGANSMLALMYAAYRLQDPFGECWIMPLADAAGGVQASGLLTITGPAAGAGTLSVYIAGVLVPVPVASGDTATVIAANVVAEMALVSGLSCTATATAGVVTFTALHKGAAQNDIDLRLNYRANAGGEAFPPGVSAVVTAFTGGATNPVLTTAFANLGNRGFDFIAVPYTDPASLASVAALLSDVSGRWSPLQGLYGHAFMAYRGTVSGRNTFGATLNNQHMTVLGFYNSPTPAWIEAADWAGAHAVPFRNNPAIGIVGTPLGLLAPPTADQDTQLEMNILLWDGLSTFTVDATGQCRIGRSITTYTTNASGQTDDSYLNTALLFQAMYVARYFTSNVRTQYQNKILVDDGNIIAAGSQATTPSLIFQAVCAMYAYLSSQNIVQNPQTFAKNGYAQKGTKGQVLLYLPIDFSDQVFTVAALISFIQTT